MRRLCRGSNIEVSFDLDQCIHVGECLRRLPEAFALNRRPWVSPDAASADDVAAVIERCPSGALQYRRLDGGRNEDAPEPASVTPLRNGPLLVRGRIIRIAFRAPGDVIHIELSPVRRAIDQPMAKASDPRGA